MLFHQLLRACSVPARVLIDQAISLTNQTSDATRTLTLSNIAVGDMLIAMTARRTGTPPILAAGWTNITTAATNSRALRMQLKIAAATTESVVWTGAYGYMVALKNARVIGKTGTAIGNDSVTVQPIPALAALDTSGTSLILAGGWATSVTTGADAPFAVLYPTNAPASGCAVYVQGNTEAALSGKTFTWASSGDPASYAVEILK